MDVLTAVLSRVQVFMGCDAVTLGHRFQACVRVAVPYLQGNA
jgi:hypothetical protein